MSEDLRNNVIEWISKNSFNPMKFKSRFPEVMILLGYNENDRYAKGMMSRLYDWLYETHAPICENPSCNNTTNFLRFVDGYNRFCCKKCTFSDPTIKAKRNPKRTQEEKDIISKKKKETLDNHTEEEKEAIKKKRIAGHAKRTLEEEQARRDAISKFWQDLSKEDLAIRQQKTDEAKKPERIAILQARIENHVIPLFSWETDYKGVDHNFEYKFQCKKCNTEFMDDLDESDKPEFKISINDILIKVCALALFKNPKVNSAWYGDKIIQFGNVDISVAVAIDDGLMTPIVRNANQKSLIQISNEVKELAKKAKSQKLKPEEYQGGGFTISNLGMYSIKSFYAIINPPQSCILSIGGTREIPAYGKSGNLEKKQVMNISLSCDHRVVDGATAAIFLSTFKRFVENPSLMICY